MELSGSDITLVTSWSSLFNSTMTADTWWGFSSLARHRIYFLYHRTKEANLLQRNRGLYCWTKKNRLTCGGIGQIGLWTLLVTLGDNLCVTQTSKTVGML